MCACLGNGGQMTMKITSDTFFNGTLQVRQLQPGYRFSIDAVLLAHLVSPHRKDTVLDLGAGCGIVSLMLAHRHPDIRVFGIEIQPELAALALENAASSGLAGRVDMRCGDMRVLTRTMIPRRVDLVVTNPPYRRVGSGKISSDVQRAVARHELKVSLDEVLHAAARMLYKNGRFAVIYGAERTVDLLARMRAAGLEPKYLRMVHARRREVAKMIYAEGCKAAAGGLKIGPPLIVYRADGSYCTEVKRMFDA